MWWDMFFWWNVSLTLNKFAIFLVVSSSASRAIHREQNPSSIIPSSKDSRVRVIWGAFQRSRPSSFPKWLRWWSPHTRQQIAFMWLLILLCGGKQTSQSSPCCKTCTGPQCPRNLCCKSEFSPPQGTWSVQAVLVLLPRMLTCLSFYRRTST